MTGTSSFLSQNSHETLVAFVLVASNDALGTQWPSFISHYIDSLRDRLSEDHPHRQTRIVLVEYCVGPPVSFDPSYVVGGHDEMRGLPSDVIITGVSLELAALCGYKSIFKMIDDFHVESYHLWHIAVGQHDDPHFDVSPKVSPASLDPNWELVRHEVTQRNINLSIILINRCPKLRQLFFATTRARIQPWFYAHPDHSILLSGFVLSEVMALDSSPDPLPHGTQYVMDNQRPGTSTSQLAGSDVYRQVTATVPNLNPYEDAQASSLTAMQTQPHVPGAQGPAPVPWPVSPHGGGVEEQQPMLHDCAGAFNASGDLASASAGPAAQGVSRGMGWTGRLHWDGRCIHAQAKAAEAVLNPKLSEWPDDLQLEPVADPELSTLDSQAWMRKTKPPMALLRCICDTDNCDFDQLIEALSNGHGYATVRWEKHGQTLERLLLVAAGKTLLCAAFPDTGILERPKPRPPQPIRVTRSPPNKNTKKSQKSKKSKSGPQSNPVVAPTSPPVHPSLPLQHEGLHFEAAQNGVTLLQVEQQQVGCHHPPHAKERALPEGDPYPVRYEGQVTQYQTTSPPEQQPLVQAHWDQQSLSPDVTGVDRGLNDWPTDAVAASRVAYMSGQVSNFDFGTTDANTFGSDAGSSLGGYPTSENLDTWNSGHYDWPS